VVRLTGEPDAETGYVFDLKALSDIVKAEIISRFDHKNLNLDVPEFKNCNPTAENIAITIWNLLRTKINKKFELKVLLYETERNYVEYPA
jgi:6-pyruvoyltetrahydropterin/6-carboxytetrahydropterin synthase